MGYKTSKVVLRHGTILQSADIPSLVILAELGYTVLFILFLIYVLLVCWQGRGLVMEAIGIVVLDEITRRRVIFRRRFCTMYRGGKVHRDVFMEISCVDSQYSSTEGVDRDIRSVANYG